MAFGKEQPPGVPFKSETLTCFIPNFIQNLTRMTLCHTLPNQHQTNPFSPPNSFIFFLPRGSSRWAKSLPWDALAPRARTPTLRKWRRWPSAPASLAPAGAAETPRPRRPRRPRRSPIRAAKGPSPRRKKPPNGGGVSSGNLSLGKSIFFGGVHLVCGCFRMLIDWAFLGLQYFNHFNHLNHVF